MGVTQSHTSGGVYATAYCTFFVFARSAIFPRASLAFSDHVFTSLDMTRREKATCVSPVCPSLRKAFATSLFYFHADLRSVIQRREFRGLPNPRSPSTNNPSLRSSPMSPP